MPLPLAGYAVATERLHNPTRPLESPGPLRFWHLASFDAPSVAVVWTLSFAWTAGVHLPMWVPVLIAIGTWWVYVADRLLDTRRALTSDRLDALRERHFFHWRHRIVLLPLCACAAAASIAIIFSQMPATIRERDSVLAAAALAYFSGIHAPGVQLGWVVRLRSKELLVGVLFTAGCAVPTLTRIHGTVRDGAMLVCLTVCYAALAWLNCAAIDRWESGETSDIAPAAMRVGIAAVLIGVVGVSVSPRGGLLAAACAVSALLLWALDRFRDRLTPLTLRCAADMVLLTPIVCLMR